MQLSNTAYVVLGALEGRPKSGYDIKQFADKDIRLFWAVGFAQLYPELKHLCEAGLIEAEDASTGGRKRTLYRNTDLGREALADWVSDPDTPPQELRDELLVRLFFSDVAEPSTRIRLANLAAERHRAARAGMYREKEKSQAALPGPWQPMHREVFDLGVAYHTFMSDWFDGLAERLSGPQEEEV
jgi:DNA-binding PadR family transcriptional regulator